MTKIVTYGTVSATELKIYNRAKFKSEVLKLRRKSDNETTVKITVERKKKTRSTMQNAYYWGVVIDIITEAISDAHGEKVESEDVHALLKSMFNFAEIVNESTGEVVKIPLSTIDLSTAEFEDYLEKCRRFAYEFFGITIPLPNEQSILEL